MTRLDKVLAVYEGIAERDVDLAVRHLDPDRYLEHDPHVGDGVEGVRRYVAALSAADDLRVVRAMEDGDLVVVQADGRVRNDGTFFDVFRFERDRVVEHWGFASPAAPPNRSDHTQADGPAEAGSDADTVGSQALVRDYYETFHIAGRHDLADRWFAGSPMVRHEPGAADGVEAFLSDLRVLTRDRTIDEIRLLAGRGALVFLAALGTHGGAPCAYVDLYRVAEGKVMEHWGFPQPIPPAAERANGNSML